MGRSLYTRSVTSSTRTFQTAPPATAEPIPKKPGHLSRLRGFSGSLLTTRLPWLLIVILIITSLFLFMQYREAQAKLSPAHTAQQINATLAQITKLAVVPTNETPTVVTVADVSKLKGQSFFVNAKSGDKVIVYNHAKQAILYRPSTNQIVNMAPVTNGAQ